jgi:YidC/Oxa1 family membrane protein insertase
LELVLATNVLLDPIVAFLSTLLTTITAVTHNFGWSLIVLAVLVKLVFWPLNTMQFSSISRMQALQPKMKALQAKYKGDPQKLQQEQMALYKEAGVNPFASCLPLLLQLPILYSVYFAINSRCSDFAQTSFLWIGSAMAKATPVLGQFTYKCPAGTGVELHLKTQVLASSLLLPDYFLLALYVVSMYFSVRLSSPAMDAQQAQQQKIMALISPVMIAFIGRFWPSALILYWLTFNVLTMGQQFLLMRRFRAAQAAGGSGSGGAAVPANPEPRPDGSRSADLGAQPGTAPNTNGSTRRQRRRRGSRR